MLGPNLAILFTVIAWATNIPASAVLLENWDPWFLSMVRFGSGYAALWLLMRWREPAAGRGALPVASWRLSPAIAAVVGRICFGQPIERRMFPAIALAVLGCGLATWDPGQAGNPFAVRGGEPLILLAMALWSWYSLAAQRWLPGWSQMRITTATLGPGVAMIIAFYVIAGLLGFASLAPEPLRGPTDAGLILWISVGGVAFAMMFWNYSVQRLGLVTASLFLNLMPIITILVLALMGRMPTWLQLAGTGLVVLGLLQAQLRGFVDRKAAA
jgi:drug/metabolite transporter (DMT)-like permease